MTPNVKNVVIDGLIFAGKTTAISNLKARLTSSVDTTYNFFEEPVNSWMNEGWLEKYYSNISKFASSFQIRIILSHIQQKNEIEEINRGQEAKNIVNICIQFKKYIKILLHDKKFKLAQKAGKPSIEVGEHESR
jgi:deoxyadenosine/deoxycytidine kinase